MKPKPSKKGFFRRSFGKHNNVASDAVENSTKPAAIKNEKTVHPIAPNTKQSVENDTTKIESEIEGLKAVTEGPSPMDQIAENRSILSSEENRTTERESTYEIEGQNKQISNTSTQKETFSMIASSNEAEDVVIPKVPTGVAREVTERTEIADAGKLDQAKLDITIEETKLEENLLSKFDTAIVPIKNAFSNIPRSLSYLIHAMKISVDTTLLQTKSMNKAQFTTSLYSIFKKVKEFYRDLDDNQKILVLFSIICPATVILGSFYHMAHPSEKSYFALKTSIFNMVLVKKGWAWTTLAWLYLTYSTDSLSTGVIGRYAAATLWWVIVTQWAWGAPIMDRTFVWTGGNCDHPERNDILRSATCRTMNGSWIGGHDLSGHIFILTHSILCLASELLPRFQMKEQLTNSSKAVILLISIWWLMLFTTAAYFHTWKEKITGLILGYLWWSIQYIFGPQFIKKSNRISKLLSAARTRIGVLVTTQNLS